MRKVLFFLFTMLQTTMSAQNFDIIFQDMSDGQTAAVESILRSLPEKDGSKFIVLEGDTVYEKKDSLGFAHAVYVKSITDNTVENICGVSFGTPYEFVRYALQEKFGSPLYVTPTNITYKDIQYGSEHFNDAFFYFESKDGKGDYCLNRIILIKTARSREEAAWIKEILQMKLSWNYPSFKNIDDDYTVGALSPVLSPTKKIGEEPISIIEQGFGFELKIIKPVCDVKPYYVRLMFGPYF